MGDTWGKALRGEPLWADEALRAEVRFSNYHGWEWSVKHADGYTWQTLDSGLSRSFNGALHSLQRAIGELDSRD